MVQQILGRLIRVLESFSLSRLRLIPVGFLVFLAVVVFCVNVLASGKVDWSGLADNFVMELLGAALTFLILDLFQTLRSNRELKQRLIREMGSRDSGFALSAVEGLRHHGWLKDGSLQKVDLRRAELPEVELPYANLQEVSFVHANLQKAKLNYADLSKAWLSGCDLSGADLSDVNMEGAVLEGFVLGRARLGIDTTLAKTKFSVDTILPDRSKWTPDTEMERFTNPEHSEFWRPKPDKHGEYHHWWYNPSNTTVSDSDESK